MLSSCWVIIHSITQIRISTWKTFSQEKLEMALGLPENSITMKDILIYFDMHEIMKYAISPRKVSKYILKPKRK